MPKHRPPHHGPPHHGPPHHGPPHHDRDARPPGARGPASLEFMDRDRLDAILRPLVPDAADRRFLLRCLLDEGPLHHRGANYVLLALVGAMLDAAGLAPPPAADGHPVGMRLPPHLAEEADDAEFPLRLPEAPLLRLSGGDPRTAAAMASCLTDGPPQHALANVALVCLLEALASRDRPAPR